MNKNSSRKGFTIIELIVVIAVIGVLVLLALPKFLGYTEKAKVSQVKSDIVAYEKAIDTKRIDDDKYIKDWEKVDVPTMESLKKSLFNKKGLISDKNEVAFGGEYYKIPEDSKLVKTSLKGYFYLGQGGEVYYYDEKLANKVNGKSEGSSQPSESAPPVKPEHPTDKDLGYSEADFTWVKDYSAYTDKNGEKGYFKYTGTGRSTVEIPHVIQGVPMTSYYKMFYESPAEVTKIISTNKNVTNMRSMFENSNSTSLDLSELDTSNVTDMNSMFQNSQATSLDVSKFNTSKVTDMDFMFRKSQATSLDLSSFNTSKVTSMMWTFYNSQAGNLDLSSFDTSNVTDMNFMFYNSKAENINVSSFNTSNVNNMESMFSLASVSSLDLRNFNTSKVVNMSNMFGDSELTSLNLSSFDTSNVTNMSGMFSGTRVANLNLSNFNTSNVDDMRNMFSMARISVIDLSSFDTSKIALENMSGMFKSSLFVTTGYAKTQADANKLNATAGKPEGLTFVVKKP